MRLVLVFVMGMLVGAGVYFGAMGGGLAGRARPMTVWRGTSVILQELSMATTTPSVTNTKITTPYSTWIKSSPQDLVGGAISSCVTDVSGTNPKNKQPDDIPFYSTQLSSYTNPYYVFTIDSGAHMLIFQKRGAGVADVCTIVD